MVGLTKKLVYVEDEPDISRPVDRSFRREGFHTYLAQDGDTGFDLVRGHRPDIVLLDLKVPGLNGFDLCQAIRTEPEVSDIPIIVISASADEMDILQALGLGADDYVTKPFSTRELIARVRAVMSRGALKANRARPEWIRFGPVEIDASKQQVRRRGEALKFTRTEFRLLHFLACNPDKAYTRENLLDAVLGETACVIDRNIDVHIRSIRRKLGEPDPIRTIRGYGYRFEPDVLIDG